MRSPAGGTSAAKGTAGARRGVNGSQSHDAQGRPDSEGHAVFDLATATTPGAEAGEQPPGQGAGKEGTAGGPGGLL